MQVPANRFALRDYQKEIVEAYNNPKIDEMLLIIGRRGAKTTTTYSECLVPDLVKEVQTCVAVYPSAKMGFDNFWTNIEDDGFRTLHHMPPELLAPTGQSNSDSDMRQTMINGSIFRAIGATNYEALRGANGKKYWFDEFADQNIESVNVVAPITEANGGKRIYTGTPKIDGINGETMRRMHESFKNDKTGTKYTCYIDATHYMTAEQLEKSRLGYILRNGNDFKFKQEMMLDWGQSSSSHYYGEIMMAKAKDRTIGLHPYNQSYPVFTAWDLGRSDSMVVGFFQYFKGKPRLVDVYDQNGSSMKIAASVLKAKPYTYAWHFLPHDGTVASTNDNVQRIEILQQEGLTNVSTLKREGVSVGIGYTEDWLPKLLINEHTTGKTTQNLRLYKKKYNPNTGDYVGPEHSSASHIADMVRYLCTVLQYYFNEDGEFILAEENSQESYESDLVNVPFSSF
jgi:phage terminase large subunit